MKAPFPALFTAVTMMAACGLDLGTLSETNASAEGGTDDDDDDDDEDDDDDGTTGDGGRPAGSSGVADGGSDGGTGGHAADDTGGSAEDSTVAAETGDDDDTEDDTGDDTPSACATEAAGSCDVCFDCATADPCLAAFEACVGDDDCVTVVSCYSDCEGGGDPLEVCYAGCDAASDTGAALAEAMLTCLDAACGTVCDG